MNNPLRRRFLACSLSSTALLPLLGLGLLKPRQVMAAEWQRSAFTAQTLQEAVRAYASGSASESRDIVINAPEIAENGAKVGIEVSSTLSNVKSLAVFAEKNPLPLCATLEFSPQVLPYARMELKISESTRLRVIAKTSDGKNHVAFRDIKVTLGGCGG